MHGVSVHQQHRLSDKGTAMPERSDDGFYVGYLAMPSGYKRAVRAIVGCMIGVVIGSAAAIAFAQRDPGAAVWDTSNIERFTGTAVIEPFPAVLISQDDGTVLPHLVVQMGKVGAQEWLAPHAGNQVSVSGYLLERAGRRVIEVASEQDVEAATSSPLIDLPVVLSSQTIELQGEILDGKCYLGAMKPGDGKAHKACALLCLDGGLPPMFADTRDPATADIRLLLFDNGRSTLPAAYRDLVAEQVLVRGIEGTWGDLQVLQVTDVMLR